MQGGFNKSLWMLSFDKNLGKAVGTESLPISLVISQVVCVGDLFTLFKIENVQSYV